MNGILICQAIQQKLDSLIRSGSFKDAYRIGNCFSRDRKLTFRNLFFFLLHLSKKSLPIRIAEFMECFSELEVSEFTKQAVSKARKGIHLQAFIELVRLTFMKYYALSDELKTWHGHLIFAVDGTTLQMPQTEQNLKEFGISTNQTGTEFAMASASVLFDVLNDIIVDAQINICNYNERKFAYQHMAALRFLDTSHPKIILFDRGYPSYEFCRHLVEKEILFVMRLKKSSCVMRDTKEDDVFVDFGPKYPKGQTARLRALRIQLPDEDEILMTNIFSSRITLAMFKELYFLRWGVETKYRELKNRFLIEDFSGNSPVSIRQDFYLAIFYSNLVAILKKDIDSLIQEETDCSAKEFCYQANRGYIISRLQTHWVKILAGFEDAATVLLQIVLQSKKVRSQIRPNRKYERTVKHTKRKHHHNYKSCL